MMKRKPVPLSDRELLGALVKGPVEVTRAGFWRGRESVLKDLRFMDRYRGYAHRGWVAIRGATDTPTFGADLALMTRGPVEHTVSLTALGKYELEALTATEHLIARQESAA